MVTHKNPDELLTLPEVADEYSVHPETVRRWVRKGIVPVILVGPFKAKRISRADANRYFVRSAGADT